MPTCLRACGLGSRAKAGYRPTEGRREAEEANLWVAMAGIDKQARVLKPKLIGQFDESARVDVSRLTARPVREQALML